MTKFGIQILRFLFLKNLKFPHLLYHLTTPMIFDVGNCALDMLLPYAFSMQCICNFRNRSELSRSVISENTSVLSHSIISENKKQNLGVLTSHSINVDQILFFHFRGKTLSRCIECRLPHQNRTSGSRNRWRGGVRISPPRILMNSGRPHRIGLNHRLVNHRVVAVRCVHLWLHVG